MKTTVKVSIGRLAFHVDSDAHQRLSDYLYRLEKHFANKESGKEIVSDIEERLSELLTVRLTQPEQVVTLTMVEEVIAIMGMPDDMEEETGAGATAPPVSSPEPRYKRLYRDMEHRVIGGVCSGLSAYFNVDTALVRLFFVIFFFLGGASFLGYLILWIVIPEARTVKEKLEMCGNPNPTIADIKKKMMEEPESSQDNLFVRLLRIAARIFIVFFGITLLIVALSGFLIIPCLFLFDVVPDITTFGLLDYVYIGAYPFWVKLFLTLVLFLPFMGLVYIAVKALMGFRGKYRIGLSIFLMWIAALVGLTVVSLPALRSYARWSKAETEMRVDHCYDTLYVDVSDEYKKQYDRTVLNYHNRKACPALWSTDADGGTSFYLLADVNVIHTRSSGDIRVVYTCRAAGRNRYAAQEKLAGMEQKAALRDSLLLLEPFIFDKKNKWSGELMEVEIYVPQGKTVKFNILDDRYKEINIGWHNAFHVDIDID